MSNSSLESVQNVTSGGEVAPALPKHKPDARPKPRFIPPHAVILHNDDINGMDHVVRALMKVFRYSMLRSMKLMLQVHLKGRAIVWTGSLEVAELKAEQLLSAGADPRRLEHGAEKLRVTIEPLSDR